MTRVVEVRLGKSPRAFLNRLQLAGNDRNQLIGDAFHDFVMPGGGGPPEQVTVCISFARSNSASRYKYALPFRPLQRRGP